MATARAQVGRDGRRGHLRRALWTRGLPLADSCREEFSAQHDPIYATVHDVAARDPGPLLDLPLGRQLADPKGRGTEVEAMVGSTRHWLPLVTGYLEYQPPHRTALLATLARLPASDALDDLVDMTHLRWILLRPESEWPSYLRKTREALPALAGVRAVAAIGGWRLLHVEREPRRSQWFAAIAAGARPGRSALGTPLVPLAEDTAQAVVSLADPQRELRAANGLPLDLRVANTGAAPWPVAVRDGAPPTLTVRLVARWWRAEGPRDEPAHTQEIALPRDVPAGEELAQMVILETPPAAGTYDLEIGVRQVDGARFEGCGNEPLRLRVERVPVGPPGPRRSSTSPPWPLRRAAC